MDSHAAKRQKTDAPQPAAVAKATVDKAAEKDYIVVKTAYKRYVRHRRPAL